MRKREQARKMLRRVARSYTPKKLCDMRNMRIERNNSCAVAVAAAATSFLLLSDNNKHHSNERIRSREGEREREKTVSKQENIVSHCSTSLIFLLLLLLLCFSLLLLFKHTMVPNTMCIVSPLNTHACVLGLCL